MHELEYNALQQLSQNINIRNIFFMTKFSLKRGLDIPILGSPEQKIYDGQEPKTLAVMGTDFEGLKPKMLIGC